MMRVAKHWTGSQVNASSLETFKIGLDVVLVEDIPDHCMENWAR